MYERRYGHTRRLAETFGQYGAGATATHRQSDRARWNVGYRSQVGFEGRAGYGKYVDIEQRANLRRDRQDRTEARSRRRTAAGALDHEGDPAADAECREHCHSAAAPCGTAATAGSAQRSGRGEPSPPTAYRFTC